MFVFSGVRIAHSLVFYVMFLRSLFVFSGVCIAHSLVFYVMFLRSLFVFSGVCIAHSLVFYVMFLRALFFLLFFFFWPLYYMCFFDLRLMITPLVSSNFPYCMLSCFMLSGNWFNSATFYTSSRCIKSLGTLCLI